ncbi:MAG: rhodanese-like domain-containing protein [Actinomycetota bacterium]
MEARELAGQIDEVQVIDVRHPHEWEAGHIEGAVHIPLDQFAARMGELDKSKPVITICRVGPRSTKAVQLLKSQGYSADDVNGGMVAWARSGLPFNSSSGGLGQVVDSHPPRQELASGGFSLI